MEVKSTQQIADQIRRQILGIAIKNGGCYLAQACSSAEIIAALYTQIMNLGPSAGEWDAIPFPGVPGPDNMDYQHGSLYNGAPAPDKDRFFVSCCHYASVIYCALAATGRISPAALDKFNVDGWNMEMIGAEHSPGFENTAGSLGQTISIAAGTAHARKMRGESGLVYCLLGDGELQEGQNWECIQTAAYYKLDNFIVVIDANGQQVEGAIEDQMSEKHMKKRFSAFGAKCVTCNGHDVDSVIMACRTAHKDKPLVVICKTHGYTGVPLLKEKYPLLHFVRISEEEKPAYQAVYDEMVNKENRDSEPLTVKKEKEKSEEAEDKPATRAEKKSEKKEEKKARKKAEKKPAKEPDEKPAMRGNKKKKKKKKKKKAKGKEKTGKRNKKQKGGAEA